MSMLFEPIKVGPYILDHRVVMAPMTRLRAVGPLGIPGDLMVEYYGQRASEGGLLIAESTAISSTGIAHKGSPGLYMEAHTAGWKRVTAAVHAKRGRIFLQLAHAGRMSHPMLIGGAVPAGPSAIRSGGEAIIDGSLVPYSEPRALDRSEIPTLLNDYSRAALLARDAGFDGVELHAANGYLPDQFLEDGTNRRTDDYGGSVENRARFLLEAFDRLAVEWGADRVGVRISPTSTVSGMSDTNPMETFGYVAARLSEFGPAYLHIAERKGAVGSPVVGSAELRKHFAGPIIVASGFDKSKAEEAISSGRADLVAFGRAFVSNPDLPRRMREDIPLTPFDASTLYTSGASGYTDYAADGAFGTAAA